MFNKKLKAEIGSLKAQLISKEAQVANLEKMIKDLNGSFARREAELLDALAKAQSKEKPLFYIGRYGRVSWTKEGETYILAHKEMTPKELSAKLGISLKAASDKKYKLFKSLK